MYVWGLKLIRKLKTKINMNIISLQLFQLRNGEEPEERLVSTVKEPVPPTRLKVFQFVWIERASFLFHPLLHFLCFNQIK